MSPAIVLKPTGVFDGVLARGFRHDITDCLHGGSTLILVDFQSVTFMDSSGLGALVMALKSVRAKGGKLFLCSLNDQVRLLFELTRMDQVFNILPDAAAFENQVLAAVK